MAKIVNSDKGFKIIEFSSEEMSILTGNPTPICDDCNEEAEQGYYIAVLNQWFCRKCADEWHKIAEYYPEDSEAEEKNYNYYMQKATKHGMFEENKEKLRLKFVDVDFWNRPVFKIEDRKCYLSDVNNLFDYGTKVEQIKEFYKDKNLREHLTIHGSTIDCDPLGARVGIRYEMEII